MLPLLDDVTADEIRAVLDELEPMMVLRLFFVALVEANHRGVLAGAPGAAVEVNRDAAVTPP